MPHIHTMEGGTDPTASAYIIRFDTPEAPKILLHRHRLIKQYLQFGGHVEPTEHPWDTVTHEVLEEAGYDMDQLTLLQPPYRRLDHMTDAVLHPHPLAVSTHPFRPRPGHNHTDTAYGFTTTEEPRHTVADGESTEHVLLTQQEVEALPEADMPLNVREVITYLFSIALQEWEPVQTARFATGPLQTPPSSS